MYILLLLGLLGIIVIISIVKVQYVENFTSSISTETIITDSLSWIKPIIAACKETPLKATLINISLEKVREKSPVFCFGLGLHNLEPQFQKSNTKTILTGKSDIIALLWSQKDGKGRILGMIPNPNGTRSIFQKTNMNANSIQVMKRSNLSPEQLDSLEFVLPPRRWSCINSVTGWFPKLADEVYGNVSEDKRPVKCTKDGVPYFDDEKAKYKLVI
jgi:hypothetical protein